MYVQAEKTCLCSRRGASTLRLIISISPSEDMSLQCPSVAPTDCIWETEALSHLFLLPVHLHCVCLSALSLNNTSVCQKGFDKWLAQVREEGNALMELRKLDTCTHILYTALNWTPDDLYYKWRLCFQSWTNFSFCVGKDKRFVKQINRILLRVLELVISEL